jgi:hypothetical protein
VSRSVSELRDVLTELFALAEEVLAVSVAADDAQAV